MKTLFPLSLLAFALAAAAAQAETQVSFKPNLAPYARKSGDCGYADISALKVAFWLKPIPAPKESEPSTKLAANCAR